MDADLKQSMHKYYDERAPEYEEIYTLGAGPASISDPDAYTNESDKLSKLTNQLCKGNLIDIACGTGFWMPNYAEACSEITLFDQSPNMLSECKIKAERLGILEKCTFIRGDFFEHAFENDAFDFAVIGFFLSHVPEEIEPSFFEKLKGMLKPGGSFLILDSIWSDERAKTREKISQHQRKLNDGRTFDIYKRYFIENDFKSMADKYNLSLSVVHTGRVFIAPVGKTANRR